MDLIKQDIIFLGKSLQKGRLYHKLHHWDSNASPYTDSYSTKVLEYRDKSYELGLWGTMENERYYTMIFFNMRSKDGYVFIYDVSKVDEFRQLPIFINSLKESNNTWKAKLLIGVSTSGQRKVTQQQARMYARENDMIFQEITWEQSERSVLDLFGMLSEEIYIRSQKKIEASAQKFTNEKVKLDRKEYVAEIKRLNTQQQAMNKKTNNLRRLLMDSRYQKKQMEDRIYQLQSKLNLMELTIKQETQKLSRFEHIEKKIINPLYSKHLQQVLEIIPLYEADTLRIRQTHEQIIRQHEMDIDVLNFRCLALQRICEELEGVTVSNLLQKINFLTEEYSKYKAEYYIEHRLSMGEPERFSGLYEILKGLNISQIL